MVCDTGRVETKTNRFCIRRRTMIYYCIKPIEVSCYKVSNITVSSGATYQNTNTIWEADKHLINEGDDIDILDVEELFDGTYTIMINSINRISSIHKLDIDHFVTHAEWREKQIKSVIDA